MPRTAFVYHPDVLLHDTGSDHPERSARIRTTLKYLQQQPLWNKLVHFPPQEASSSDLLRVHSQAHIDQVAGLNVSDRPIHVSADTIGSNATYRAALLAAGAPIAAIDALLTDRADNAFCCIRPPGHHAEFDQIMGFCFFNNVAIAANYLRAECGVDRVAIIDWDVHHGNGTQHTFETDNSVFFFSIHQFPHYPGTGSARERGLAEGQGSTLNIPVKAGSTDEDFLRHFEQDLAPALEVFKPQFILLSAGFDAHRNDPLSQILLSVDGYRSLTQHVRQMAELHCNGRLISMLEGGYDLQSTAQSIAAHLQALMAN